MLFLMSTMARYRILYLAPQRRAHEYFPPAS